jgi:ABC-type sugar transport system permease subunit
VERRVEHRALRGFISVSLEAVLGMLVALVLNAEFKGRGLVRAAILIPWAIPTIVSAKHVVAGCSTTSSASSTTC